MDEGTLNEGDDILIDPKHLKLFCRFELGESWVEKLAVRGLLEKDGVQLTNTAQLKEFGLTNFVIQRAPPPTNAPGETPKN